MELIATCTFGLEKIVKDELKELDLWFLKTEDGKVTFKGDEKSIITANKNLRCASRVEIKMGEFIATTFDELFDHIKNIEWEKFIGKSDKFPVKAMSTKSILHSEPAIQSIIKKSIVKRLQEKHQTESLPENSKSTYQIVARCNKNKFLLSIDTSGESLHKRGYRKEEGEAPIKETLAAGMIKLSDWNKEKILIDPFCGSGTILTEAALMTKNKLHTQDRKFAFESWQWMEKFIKEYENTAHEGKKQSPKIFGFDIDKKAIETALKNAKSAGVEDLIVFKNQDFNNANFQNFENTTFITNPPYGERMEEKETVSKIYKDFGEKFKQTKNCSLFLITSREDFPTLFGRKETKNRKLFNGNIKCYLYYYLP